MGSGGLEGRRDFDEPAGVGVDAGGGEVEGCGVGKTACCCEDVGGQDRLPALVGERNAEDDLAGIDVGHFSGCGVGVDVDVGGGEDRGHLLRYVGVFVGEEPWTTLDDGDFRAEAAEHLGELDAYVAAADDGEVLGDRVKLHDAGGVEVGDLFGVLDLERRRSASCVDEVFVGSHCLSRRRAVGGDFDLFLTREPSFTHDEIQPFCAFDTALAPTSEALNNVPLSFADSLHVQHQTRFLELGAIFWTSSCQMSHATGSNHSLGRRTTFIDACSTDVCRFDQSSLLTGARECLG